ncbi:MAG: hypothetical protein JSV86_16950 [Gemmatimonadota bacterium]|nr:MAG: hypothetical protein JSV86_16950 [Gemmatimonadota bacterium]
MKPILTFAETYEACKHAIESKVALLIEGPPGIGKTALANLLEKDPDVNLPVKTFIASNCDATDIAGFPVVVDGVLKRIPMQVIRECADAPAVLFADELTTTPPAVRGPCLRLWLERVAGDLKLHDGTALIGACNVPEHCPGAFELDAATGNRFIQVVMAPTIDELRSHIESSWGVKDADPVGFREEALDLAATMRLEAGMIQFNPTPDAIQSGAPYGSPRAWERGLRTYCVAGGGDNRVARALLEGAVGSDAAATYLGIKKLRSHLPAIDAIERDPNKAKVPEKREYQIAALGLLARLARKDSYAAWIYCNRLAPEARFAATRTLLEMPDTPAKDTKWFKAGKQAKLQAMTATRKDLG